MESDGGDPATRKSSRTPIIFVTASRTICEPARVILSAPSITCSPVVPEILRTKVKVFVDLHRMTIEMRRHAEERVALAREQAAREVAERSAEALRRSEERFRLASEAVNGFIYEVDLPTGRFAPSPGIRELLGFPPMEAGSLTWWDDRVHPDDLAALRIARHSTHGPDRPTYRHQYRVRHCDGHILHVWDQGLAVQNERGQVTRLVGNVVDVTEQKRLEEELMVSNRRKDEFLSMLAHELRNPLARFAMLSVCYDSRCAVSNLRSVRDVIDRNVSQLVRLVDDLLDVSRINHGKIRVERKPVDLRDRAQAVEIAMPLIDRGRNDCSAASVDSPIRVLGDLVRLTQ